MRPTYRITSNYCPLLNTSYFKCFLNISRFKSKVTTEKKIDTKSVGYKRLVTFRQKQAENSIMIQINKINDLDTCRDLCSMFGNISHIFHYTTNINQPNMVLVEYSSQKAVENILNEFNSTNKLNEVPVHATVFEFHKSTTRMRKLSTQNIVFPKYSHTYPTIPSITSNLRNIESISEQMIMFSKLMELTDVDIRLRYVTAHQLLRCFSKLFPTISILPFGSSATNLGAMGCDLDLVCTFDKKLQRPSNKDVDKFVLVSKSFSLVDRQEQQEFLRSISFVMHYFIPGINNMKIILNARVPIIKFHYQFTWFQCDLSSNNLSGFYMTEILYTFTEIDCRVKPLIFTIRKWAESTNITSVTSPTNKITNFSLTLLIIFYLQLQNILPPVAAILNNVDVNSTCTLLSQMAIEKQVTTTLSNKISLEELLLGFFEFYATFDFNNYAICVREGKILSKLNSSPLYIYNPLEPTLNVSRNVSLNELTFFIEKTISAISIMTDLSNKLRLLNLLYANAHIVELKTLRTKTSRQTVLSVLEEQQRIKKR